MVFTKIQGYLLLVRPMWPDFGFSHNYHISPTQWSEIVPVSLIMDFIATQVAIFILILKKYYSVVIK